MRLVIAFLAVLFVAEPAYAKEPERCVPLNAAAQEQLDKYNGVEVCNPIKGAIVVSPYTFLAEALNDLPPPKLVQWKPANGTFEFSVANDPQFANYVICSASRRFISEIPGPGRYLKHGLGKLTSNSLDYWIFLKKRGFRKGRTSLNVDVRVAWVPTQSLAAARATGACQTTAQLRKALIARPQPGQKRKQKNSFVRKIRKVLRPF